jgi:beta-lactam-binding protein with PASTA domain
MKNFLIKLGKHPLVVNLLAVIVVSCAVIYATLKWLDAYTMHNQAVSVPDVRGLQVEEASLLLSKNGLLYDVIDSVFSKNVMPGAIVELLPSTGSKVKEGRIILLTVNAHSSQMAIIPEVRDMSFRQAYALLTARGFESIEIESVAGMYKDLAVGVELYGRSLEAGQMVQITAPIVLKVSNGTARPGEDSLSHNGGVTPKRPSNRGSETWF